ncbi:hypothetical protein [Neorhizobium galegae]|nr:hypothetical protein [Neorhizobium galegae]
MISETELERQADLAKANIEADKFAPGSYGCHEALHTASLLMEMVSRHLVEHPTIMLDSEFYARARGIHGELFDLYQAIGAKHLSQD